MMLQLNPPLWVQTPHGEALAHVIIHDGVEMDLLWVCVGEDGQIWTWPSNSIRASRNIQMGREHPERPIRKHLSEYAQPSAYAQEKGPVESRANGA